MNQKGQSEILFENLYLKLCKKVKETPDTFFENIDLSSKVNEEYNKFKTIQNGMYYNDFLQESSTYEKNKIIKEFIENETLSDIYTEVYDNLLFKGDNRGYLSFKEEYLAENTEKAFNCVYKGLDNHEVEKYNNLLEESFLSSGGAGVILATGALASLVSLPLALLPAAAYFGSILFLPVKNRRNVDSWIKETFGTIGASLVGLGSSFEKGGIFGSSVQNIHLFVF